MISSFKEVSQKYRAIFLDAYGVLKSSTGILPGVPEVLAELQSQQKELFVVTNDASRSPEAMSEAYSDSNGQPLISADRFVSSGTIASDYLAAQVPYGQVAYLGKPASAHYIEMAGFIPVPVGEAGDGERLVAIALLDDEGFDWFTDINATLNLVRRKNIPVIIANADLTYPMKGNSVGIAVGSLGALLSSITEKTFIRFGKPDTMMFTYAYDKALAVDPTLAKKDILFVGDTLRTDILGANQFGLDTALVLSGNTLPQTADLMIKASGIIPTYVCNSISD